MHNGLEQLLDPCGGEDTAWLIVRQWGSQWPRWLSEQLRGARLVVVVAQEPGEAHDTLCDRVDARVAKTGLLRHRVTGVLLCSKKSGFAERKALISVVAEQVAKARRAHLISAHLLN